MTLISIWGIYIALCHWMPHKPCSAIKNLNDSLSGTVILDLDLNYTIVPITVLPFG